MNSKSLDQRHNQSHDDTKTIMKNAAEKSVMSVFEHQRLTLQDFAYASDFMWLMAQELPVFSIKRQRGQWQLKVSHYIGVILLPSNISLEILPKTIATVKRVVSEGRIAETRQWVEQMLTTLINANNNNNGNNKLPASKHFGQLSAHLSPLPLQSLPLSQWLIEQFLQLLASYQPSKHYQTTIQNQATLQGKLLIKEQLRRNSYQPHKFVSEVSTLSTQMLSNRLIKSALQLIEPLLKATVLPKYLLAWRAILALNSNELQQLDSLYTTAKQQLSQQPLATQQLKIAQRLLAFAYWLLKTQASTMPAGNVLRSSVDQPHATAHLPPLRLCLLLNMNQAFEQWASLSIAESFTESKAEYQPYYQSQHVWLQDSSGETRLSMRPDLLIYKHQRCSHVIDIKWKALTDANELSASDAYQLSSYAQAYQAEQVWLVYPVSDDSRRPTALHRQLDTRFSEPISNQTINQIKTVTASEAAAVTLWLIPFNILTGCIEHWPSTSRG